MMEYCNKGSRIVHGATAGGLDRCMFGTIVSGAQLLFIVIQFLLFGCALPWSRHSVLSKTRTSPGHGPRSPLWYTVLAVLTIIMAIEPFILILVSNVMNIHGGIAGVDIVTSFCTFAAWAISIRTLTFERQNRYRETSGRGLILRMFWTLSFFNESLALVNLYSHSWWWYLQSSNDHAEFGFWVVRVICTGFLFLMGWKSSPSTETGYVPIRDEEDQDDDDKFDEKSRLHETVHGHTGSTWKNTWKKARTMAPMVWPKGSWWRQAIVWASVLLLIAGRVINVFVPIFNKKIVNSLTEEDDTGDGIMQFRWDYIVGYAGLVFLAGSGGGISGFLNDIRVLMWIPVQQYTTRLVQLKLFSHLHNLSLGYHLGRKTGELLRIVDRGTNSINRILNYVVFQITPTLVDVVIAIIYFVTVFNYIFGLVVMSSMLIYLVSTVLLSEWRTRYRREMNRMDNAMGSVAVDSLLNVETVKYYGASDFEIERYNKAILDFQKPELAATAALNILNTVQNIVLAGGVLSGSMVCAYAVVHSIGGLHLTVGDYVMFGTYLIQLYGPLTVLGTYYKTLQTAFIDMENMFDLLEIEPEVVDELDASEMSVIKGDIEFRNVRFGYTPQKEIIKGLTFKVPAGQTYALVGHSGSGKSTIVRLLFRFYDIQSGCILIDDQDISKVKQDTLRKAIGVVPQDTALFNRDIMYNIRYGNLTASDEQVEQAAEAADIHKTILSFPEEYQTTCGERGFKLSGGEKQRIAIARTLLKAPAIVLLDEATSALDTKTERSIQTSLAHVCENRTTIIVAHRLSTIIHADQILVMSAGEIIERGTHTELLADQGHYYEMWQQQLSGLEHSNSSLTSHTG